MLRLVLALTLVWWGTFVAAGDFMAASFPHALPKFGEESMRIPRSTSERYKTSCQSCGEPLRGYDGGLGRTEGPVVWPWSNEKYNPQSYSAIRRGRENTESFRVYFQNKRGPISPFHDIPLYADRENNIFNMVVKVPRWQNADLEISNELPLNPLSQEVRNGQLGYAPNIFPFHGYSWNYGSFPQTWEDPNVPDKLVGLPGDNHPIDVFEMGQVVAKVGEVIKVKVLAVLGIISEGVIDWKVFAININDVMAKNLNDLSDINSMLPGFIGRSREWLFVYQIPDGKPENTVAFDNQAQNKSVAEEIVLNAYESWQKLILGKTSSGGIELGAVRVPNSVDQLSVAQAQDIVDASPKPGPPAPRPERADGIDFIVSSGYTGD